MELSPYVISAPATSRLLAIDPECQGDPFYRYQTHQLVVAFQGKRALLTNLDTVAHNLQTSADCTSNAATPFTRARVCVSCRADSCALRLQIWRRTWPPA
jgi:hypothetical protein